MNVRATAFLRSVAPLALLLALAGTAACGGGTEVAAPGPTVAGSGLATASVDAVDLGGSQLVVSGILRPNVSFPVVTEEPVTIAPDGTATLANAPVSPGLPIVVLDATTRAVLVHSFLNCIGAAVQVDVATGGLTACVPGPLAPGSRILVTYAYTASIFDVQVGVTFPAGTRADARLYNVLPGRPAPFTVNLTASGAPAGGVPAFDVTVETALTGVTGRKDYRVVQACSVPGAPDCPALNAFQVTQIDLTNQLDTCLSGRITATVHDANDVDPDSRAVLLLDFSDPVCP